MEGQLEELAAKGAEVLVAGLWARPSEQSAELAFAAWFERHGQGREADLIRGFHSNRAPSDTRGAAQGRWSRRFQAALLHDGDGQATVELARLVKQFTAPVRSQRLTADGLPAQAVTAGDHVDFRLGTFNAPVIGVQHNTYGAHPGGAVLADPDSWPRQEDIDPITLGVRPTRRLGDEVGLPAYVLRDVDASLRGWTERHGLLVITGGPLSGKSRTAWAAIYNYAEFTARVYAPAPGTDLRQLPGLLRGRDDDYILWLDELEGHLGEHGLDLGLLAQLTALRVPVVATMSDEKYDELRFGGGPASRLLGQARTVSLSSRWSEKELERLARETDEPRLVDALAWRGETGVTQYLAIGPELWELWQRSALSNSRHPHGHVVVRAAIDLARCGLTGDIPQDLLEEACRCYGQNHVAGRPERESPQEALAWAAEPRHGVTGLLVRGARRRVGESDETWRPYGSLVADALRDPAQPPVPIGVWRCALEGTRYDTDLHNGVRRTAHDLSAAKAEGGDTEAMHLMGLLSETEGDEATALEWFRRAVDAGKRELSGRVGELLLGRGETEQALPYLRAAAEGNPEGREARLLGSAHLMLAKHWLREAAGRGDAEAAHQFGDLLFGGGDKEGAFHWYHEAVKAGREEVAMSFGALHRASDEVHSAEIWFRRAAAAGDARGGEALWVSPYSRSLDEAEAYFRADAEEGVAMHATHLGALLEKRGRVDEARTWYLKGHELGDAYAAYLYAGLLKKEGNDAEALAWYRKAADLGHPAAQKALAENPDTVKE